MIYAPNGPNELKGSSFGYKTLDLIEMWKFTNENEEKIKAIEKSPFVRSEIFIRR